MLAPGSRAPEFTLPDQDGRDRSLTSLLSDGSLILYFYPADFTPGCTAEACSLRDLHADIQRAGLRVVGVSPQNAESHKRFAQKYGLKYTLLADPDKTVIKMYDVDGPFGIAVRRATYLIDQQPDRAGRGAGRLSYQSPRGLRAQSGGAAQGSELGA